MIDDLKAILQGLNDVLFAPPPDPKRFAQTPPKGWNGASPATPPGNADFIVQGGGSLVWDGEFTHYPAEPGKELEKHGVTAKEWGEMQEFQVSKSQRGLNNLALAGLIKRHWLEGRDRGEIAALTGFNASTVRQYILCLERARANAGNAFCVEFPAPPPPQKNTQ